jgi:hypothetical protein
MVGRGRRHMFVTGPGAITVVRCAFRRRGTADESLEDGLAGAPGGRVLVRLLCASPGVHCAGTARAGPDRKPAIIGQFASAIEPAVTDTPV